MPSPPADTPTTTPLPGTPRQLAAEIKRFATAEAGFDLVGIARAGPSMYGGYLRAWLDAGRAGSMHYLAERLDERLDPAAYFPGARSVICVALNYHARLEPVPEAERPHRARVARYALGDDYHQIIKHRLYALADWLRDRVPGARTRCGVDTVPVMEKELAARAGLGWVGKNTCLINPKSGSWLLLGEVLTTLDLPPDEPGDDHCGTCTRCIDACPTRAITAPYQLDATRCISYLTIETGRPVPQEQGGMLGEWLFGCDVCQDVCPHNARAPFAADPALRPRFPTGTLDLRDVLAWDLPIYHRRLRGSAMRRVKLPVLQANARAVRENLRAAVNPAAGAAAPPA